MMALGFIVFITLIAAFAPLVARLVNVDQYEPDAATISTTPRAGYRQAGCNRESAWIIRSGSNPAAVATSPGCSCTERGSRSSSLATSTVLVVLMGVVIGAATGYLGGRFDAIVGRLMDFVLVFPLLLMLIALSAPLTERIEDVHALVGQQCAHPLHHHWCSASSAGPTWRVSSAGR